MISQVVIFVKSVQRANTLNSLLNDCNFPSVCIHRGMDQVSVGGGWFGCGARSLPLS